MEMLQGKESRGLMSGELGVFLTRFVQPQCLDLRAKSSHSLWEPTHHPPGDDCSPVMPDDEDL